MVNLFTILLVGTVFKKTDRRLVKGFYLKIFTFTTKDHGIILAKSLSITVQ